MGSSPGHLTCLLPKVNLIFISIGVIFIMFRTVTLKLIGKTSIIMTPNSSLIRCYLTNGQADYVLVIWEDKFKEVLEFLKLNSVRVFV